MVTGEGAEKIHTKTLDRLEVSTSEDLFHSAFEQMSEAMAVGPLKVDSWTVWRGRWLWPDCPAKNVIDQPTTTKPYAPYLDPFVSCPRLTK